MIIMKNKGFLNNGFYKMISVIVLATMIFWQTILILIFPIRFNALILLIEIILLFLILLPFYLLIIMLVVSLIMHS